MTQIQPLPPSAGGKTKSARLGHFFAEHLPAEHQPNVRQNAPNLWKLCRARPRIGRNSRTIAVVAAPQLAEFARFRGPSFSICPPGEPRAEAEFERACKAASDSSLVLPVSLDKKRVQAKPPSEAGTCWLVADCPDTFVAEEEVRVPVNCSPWPSVTPLVPITVEVAGSPARLCVRSGRSLQLWFSEPTKHGPKSATLSATGADVDQMTHLFPDGPNFTPGLRWRGSSA